MGRILEHWRIPAALALAAIILAGSYSAARMTGSPSSAQASDEALSLLASKDSDTDGLPDWMEALYGTDPHKTDTKGLGMTDKEAVAHGLIVPKAIADISVATSTQAKGNSPDYSSEGLSAPSEGTVTDVFAKSFFSLYLASKERNMGMELNARQAGELADQALDMLSASVLAAPDFKSESDLIVSGSGPDSLRTFAEQAEAVLRANETTAATSELMYLESALQNDQTAVQHLTSLAKAYRTSAAGLAVLPVPRELSSAHLKLVNSSMRMSGIISDFARADSDPLSAMLALSQYMPTAAALADALSSITAVYDAAGAAPGAGAPGAVFVRLGASIP